MPNRKEPRLEIDAPTPIAQAEAPKTEAPQKKPATSGSQANPNAKSTTSNPQEAVEKTTQQAASQPENLVQNQAGPVKRKVAPASSGGSFKAWVGILLAVLALGLLAWQFMQFQQANLITVQQQATMQLLANRIQELEIRLSETGDDLSATGSNFNERLDFSMSEIDKLWKVAYRTNRPAIQGLENKTQQLEQSLSKTAKQMEEVHRASKAAVTKSLAFEQELKKQAQDLDLHLKTLGQHLTEISLTTSTLDQRLRNQDLRTQLTALEKQVIQLNNQASKGLSDEVQAKILEQQEILTSLEASRSQLVSRVTRLMEEVRELQQAH